VEAGILKDMPLQVVQIIAAKLPRVLVLQQLQKVVPVPPVDVHHLPKI